MIFKEADTEYLWIADTIEKFVTGTCGQWDWDDLISIASPDPYLRHIQEQCNIMQDRFPADEKGRYCNEEGCKALLLLAREVRDKVGMWPKIEQSGRTGDQR